REFGGIKTTYDLIAVASEIADYLATERYRSTSIEAGETMPSVWLALRESAALKKALGAVRTGIAIMAESRRTKGGKSGDQEVFVFLHEMRSKAAAQEFLEIARKKKSPKPGPGYFCKIEATAGRLFCL